MPIRNCPTITTQLRSAAVKPANWMEPVASLMNTEMTEFPSIKELANQNTEPSAIIR